MMEMSPTHETQWKKIQSFDRLSDIPRGQRGLHSVADIVTAIYNAITTETAASYKEARKFSKFVEGAATKTEYFDGIGFMNGKRNTMTAFPKALGGYSSQSQVHLGCIEDDA